MRLGAPRSNAIIHSLSPVADPKALAKGLLEHHDSITPEVMKAANEAATGAGGWRGSCPTVINCVCTELASGRYECNLTRSSAVSGRQRDAFNAQSNVYSPLCGACGEASCNKTTPTCTVCHGGLTPHKLHEVKHTPELTGAVEGLGGGVYQCATFKRCSSLSCGTAAGTADESKVASSKPGAGARKVSGKRSGSAGSAADTSANATRLQGFGRQGNRLIGKPGGARAAGALAELTVEAPDQLSIPCLLVTRASGETAVCLKPFWIQKSPESVKTELAGDGRPSSSRPSGRLVRSAAHSVAGQT